MSTDLTLKLKALTLAVMINGVIMGSAAFLFDGELHSSSPAFANNGTLPVNTVHAALFRP